MFSRVVARAGGDGAAVLIAAAALAGCGGSQPAALQQPAESTGTASVSVAQRPADDIQGLLQAGETALRAVADGTVISVESEQAGGGWEVQVVTPDGTEHLVRVSADGATVVDGPTVKDEGPADRTKHRDRVAAANLDYRQAAGAINRIVAGRITELNLDTVVDRTVWEADVVDSADVTHEVKVDAGSGEVVSRN